MQTIKLKSVVNSNGIVQLQVPRELANQELELIVVYQPIKTNSTLTQAEALGYPDNFFEKTAGAWQGEALTRGEQGICDERQWELL